MSFVVGSAIDGVKAERLEKGGYRPDLLDVYALGLMHPLSTHRCGTVTMLFLVLNVVLNDSRIFPNRIYTGLINLFLLRLLSETPLQVAVQLRSETRVRQRPHDLVKTGDKLRLVDPDV